MEKFVFLAFGHFAWGGGGLNGICFVLKWKSFFCFHLAVLLPGVNPFYPKNRKVQFASGLDFSLLLELRKNVMHSCERLLNTARLPSSFQDVI